VEIRFVASLLHQRNSRVGIIVPRYKHTAVARNRLKRRLREIARQHVLPALATTPVDVVIRAHPTAYALPFEALAADVVRAATRVVSQVAQ
jgi:ribonuclease P protein component